MTECILAANIYYQDMGNEAGRGLACGLLGSLIEMLCEEFPDLMIAVSLLPGRHHGFVHTASGYADAIGILKPDEMFPYPPSGIPDRMPLTVGMYCRKGHLILTAGIRDSSIMRHTGRTLMKCGYECLYSREVKNEDIWPVNKALSARIAALIDEECLEKLRVYAEERKKGSV
ncbi:MAG: hypothetical protein K6G61_09310 [Solobacterium sp.]|nr:hypothetical protein [Solobacterium sp.]